MTWTTRALVLAAVGLVGLAGALALRPPGPPGPRYVVEAAARRVGVVGAGTHDVVFRVTNAGDRPGAVLGLAVG